MPLQLFNFFLKPHQIKIKNKKLQSFFKKRRKEKKIVKLIFFLYFWEEHQDQNMCSSFSTPT